MWDLRSPTKDQTHTPCTGRSSPWTIREVPKLLLFALTPIQSWRGKQKLEGDGVGRGVLGSVSGWWGLGRFCPLFSSHQQNWTEFASQSDSGGQPPSLPPR